MRVPFLDLPFFFPDILASFLLLSLLSFSLSILPTAPSTSPLLHTTMASTLRLGTSALRSSIAAKPAVQSAAFNGLRAYSTGKTKVCSLPSPPSL